MAISNKKCSNVGNGKVVLQPRQMKIGYVINVIGKLTNISLKATTLIHWINRCQSTGSFFPT